MYAEGAVMRDVGRLVLPAALAVALAACSAILGVTDIQPASGQDGGAEAASDAPPQGPDGMNDSSTGASSGSDAQGSSGSSGSGSSSSGAGSSTSSGSSSSGSTSGSASSSGSSSGSSSSGSTSSGSTSSGGSDGGDLESGAGDASAGPIAFVQVAVGTLSGTTTSSQHATFAQAQQGGDLIVLAVGWGNATTAGIRTISDTAGNTYRAAIGPENDGQNSAEAIYYASGIHPAGAGANTVTVELTTSAFEIDVRALEYSGLDVAAPLDATAWSSAVSTSASSGPATTTFARELLVGAGMTGDNFVSASPGFAVRTITPNGNIAEDQIVTRAGSYAAGGSPSSNGSAVEWIMLLATFH